MTPDELPAYLEHFRARVDDPGGRAAADGMVRAFDQGIKTHELRRYSHPLGTPTPSPPGGTPALVTGRLRDSFKIRRAESLGAYRWGSSDRPTVVYAHIHEYGGDIYPRVKQWLHWVDAGGSHFAKHVRMPKRPYMHPARERMVADGTLHNAAARSFLEAVGL